MEEIKGDYTKNISNEKGDLVQKLMNLKLEKMGLSVSIDIYLKVWPHDESYSMDLHNSRSNSFVVGLIFDAQLFHLTYKFNSI